MPEAVRSSNRGEPRHQTGKTSARWIPRIIGPLILVAIILFSIDLDQALALLFAVDLRLVGTVVLGIYDPTITSIDFFLTTVTQSSMPEPGLPILLVQPTEMALFGTSAGFDDEGNALPVAHVGAACGVVDVEDSTWGSVKSLYR